MARRVRYMVDASVLMEAHRRYYRFGLCPGFWDCLVWHHKQGVVSSIDRVKNEIDEGKDTLAHWVKRTCPSTFFESTKAVPVGQSYGDIVSWAQSQKQYKPEALAEFANAADGWLVAYAREHEFVVVTQEVSAPESRKEVKIPDVCGSFTVKCVDTFEMLEQLKVSFSWKP